MAAFNSYSPAVVCSGAARARGGICAVSRGRSSKRRREAESKAEWPVCGSDFFGEGDVDRISGRRCVSIVPRSADEKSA